MTDKEYLKKMVVYFNELERIAEARPYDSDAFNKVIDAMNKTKTEHFVSWRRRWLFLILSVVFLLLLLFLLAFRILF